MVYLALAAAWHVDKGRSCCRAQGVDGVLPGSSLVNKDGPRAVHRFFRIAHKLGAVLHKPSTGSYTTKAETLTFGQGDRGRPARGGAAYSAAGPRNPQGSGTGGWRGFLSAVPRAAVVSFGGLNSGRCVEAVGQLAARPGAASGGRGCRHAAPFRLAGSGW